MQNTGTIEDQKFLASAQETQRLQIALKRFFETGSQEWQERYAAYLKMRLRPAMECLIATNEIEKIMRISALGWLNESILDACILLAQKKRRAEITVYLLRQKKEQFGLHGQDFTL